MNKHLIIAAIVFVVSVSTSFAQTTIEKFCEVMTRPKNGWTTKRIATISFGEQFNLFSFKDSTVINQLQKVNDLKTETDVLNYMASIGWRLVNFNYTGMYGAIEVMYFKREFDKSELAEN